MKYLFIILGVLMISACDSENKSTKFTFPYMAACHKTFDLVKADFKDINTRGIGDFSIKVEEFDFVPISNSEILGYVVLGYTGDNKNKEGYALPVDYLKSVANGVLADCMPNNSLNLDVDIDESYLVKAEAGKKYSIIKRVGNKFVLFFNGGEYEYFDVNRR